MGAYSSGRSARNLGEAAPPHWPLQSSGEDRIAMTHCEPSVVSSRDERWGNQWGGCWVSKPRGSCSAMAQKRQPTGQRGAEERKTGQSYLGHNTGKTSPEYSMEVLVSKLRTSQPHSRPASGAAPSEALHSTRLTAAPTQKGVPVRQVASTSQKEVNARQ